MKKEFSTFKRKVYLSGAISSIPYEEAKKKFDKTEEDLTAWGFEVVNPMKAVPYKEGRTWLGYMVRAIAQLIRCDVIYMLPNWKQSRGAKIERRIAKILGLWVFHVNN